VIAVAAFCQADAVKLLHHRESNHTGCLAIPGDGARQSVHCRRPCCSAADDPLRHTKRTWYSGELSMPAVAGDTRWLSSSSAADTGGGSLTCEHER